MPIYTIPLLLTLQQKQQENEEALKMLSERLATLDAMESEERQLSLVKGLMAGNVFDWGAKEVAVLMENGELGFEEALNKLQGNDFVYSL